MTKIKICGLSGMCDIEAVNIAKPDYIGFVFAKSRRQVTYLQAADLKSKLAPDIIPVGVFVNETIENIKSLVNSKVIEAIQLHGNETEDYIKDLKNLTSCTIIKGISVVNSDDIKRWENTSADYILLDNKNGGTGESFDWSLIKNVKKPYFLAGGINIENIDMALKITNPFAVDISSGVETDGLKDEEKIISIVRRIRNE